MSLHGQLLTRADELMQNAPGRVSVRRISQIDEVKVLRSARQMLTADEKAELRDLRLQLMDLVLDLVAAVWLSYHSGMSEQVVTTHFDVDGDQDPRSVALITLDDGKANALSRSMIADVRTALTAAEADPNCIAAVIAGREGRFCAGFDLSVMQAGDASEVVAMVADGGELVRHIYGATVPVVVACTGHALAAGALMLLGADIRVGAEGQFKIGLNEVAIGMTLPDWAYTIARERICKRHLQRSITNARITDPTGAVDVGFLDRVVPGDQVVAAAVEEAVALAALDTKAYGRVMREFRGETLVMMADQIAADRNG